MIFLPLLPIAAVVCLFVGMPMPRAGRRSARR
jgi:hypothetical protein